MSRIWEMVERRNDDLDMNYRRGRSMNRRDDEMEKELEQAYEEGRKQGWREAMEEQERKMSGNRNNYAYRNNGGGYSSYRNRYQSDEY